MKIAVWKTGHEIADTVANAIIGLPMVDRCSTGTLRYDQDNRCQIFSAHVPYSRGKDNPFEWADIHIGYGILRGMDEIFKECDKVKRPWFNIDKGYWKPGHYDGYYRISLRGTQQILGLDKIKPDYERWDKLELEILPSIQRDSHALICPPTDYVSGFFNNRHWLELWGFDIGRDNVIREKGSAENIQKQFDVCSEVRTFNSSVGWEALRQGIPVVSDPQHSIVGAYQKMLDKDISKDSNERRKLFAIMAGLQLRLDEIRSGLLWPLLQNLLQSTSDSTAASQSPLKSVRIL